MLTSALSRRDGADTTQEGGEQVPRRQLTPEYIAAEVSAASVRRRHLRDNPNE